MNVRVGLSSLLLTACSASQAPQQDFEKQYIQEDTEEACARTDAPRWAEVVFVSTKWREVAPRADGGDAEAWREIAAMMRANRKDVEGSLCSEQVVAEVEASAARLRKE